MTLHQRQFLRFSSRTKRKRCDEKCFLSDNFLGPYWPGKIVYCTQLSTQKGFVKQKDVYKSIKTGSFDLQPTAISDSTLAHLNLHIKSAHGRPVHNLFSLITTMTLHQRQFLLFCSRTKRKRCGEKCFLSDNFLGPYWPGKIVYCAQLSTQKGFAKQKDVYKSKMDLLTFNQLQFLTAH